LLYGPEGREFYKIMPHISLPAGLPGMLSLGVYRPDIYAHLGALADVVLRQPSPGLSCADRELIAAYVSSLNDCAYCRGVHGCISAAHAGSNGASLVENVCANHDSSQVSPKLKILLSIAGMVRESGKAVTAELVAQAKEEGATDMDIHDTVLIASMFSMFNRYVDGLATRMPENPEEEFKRAGEMIKEKGYFARVKTS
jgi:uncharacterized peroxidase-related enzyme